MYLTKNFVVFFCWTVLRINSMDVIDVFQFSGDFFSLSLSQEITKEKNCVKWVDVQFFFFKSQEIKLRLRLCK